VRAVPARTKGNTEAGVKYVKHNGLANLELETFGALERHLTVWMTLADERVRGTTREAPRARFERDERSSLRPLPIRALPAREQRLSRRVAHDALVDVDTVRYSVPHLLVRDVVEVVVGAQTVRILHGARLVATHARSCEPFCARDRADALCRPLAAGHGGARPKSHRRSPRSGVTSLTTPRRSPEGPRERRRPTRVSSSS
jgi:hypothetical protein